MIRSACLLGGCKHYGKQELNMIQWDQSKSTLDEFTDLKTQRSFNNFKIGDHRIPIEQIKALALVKSMCFNPC